MPGMTDQVAFLRGINVGASTRVPMAELRGLLEELGYAGVRTHLQSGNVLYASDEAPDEAAERMAAVVSERFGFDVAVVARTGDDLARVVELNPLAEIATAPSRHLVTFLAREPDEEAVARLDPADFLPEAFAFRGRELYMWCPDGVHKSRLGRIVAQRGLGTTGTARNWNTVTRLLEMLGG